MHVCGNKVPTPLNECVGILRISFKASIFLLSLERQKFVLIFKSVAKNHYKKRKYNISEDMLNMSQPCENYPALYAENELTNISGPSMR